MSTTTRSWTGRTVDVVFLATCVLLVAFAARNLVVANRESEPVAAVDFVSKGSTSPVMPLAQLSTSKIGTVAIVMSSTCHWCALQIPFYQRLEQLSDQLSFDVRYVSPEDVWTFSAYLTRNQLNPSRWLDARLTPGIKATPSIIVLDRGRRVLQSFQGPLSQAQQETFLSSLR